MAGALAATNSLEERVEGIEFQAAELLKFLNEDKRIDYKQPAKGVVKSFDYEEKSFMRDCPFKRSSHLFKAVRDVAVNHSGNWQQHAGMKAYIDYIEKRNQEYIRKNNYVEKSGPITGLNELQGQDGGVLVTPEFSNQLLMRTYDSDLLGRCWNLPMTTNLLNIPAVNETSRAEGSQFGGVTAYWEGEAATIPTSQPSFAMVKIEPQLLTIACYATDQLINDAGLALEMWLTKIASMVMNTKVGNALINSSGAGTGLQGIMNAPAMISVSKETGQPAASIVTRNISNMWSRLHSSCTANAIWLYDQSIEPALDQLTVGTAGAQMAVYMPPGGMSDKPYATLKGRPMIRTEFNKQLGTTGDLILWDPSTYIVGMRQAMQSAVSIHVAFLQSQQVFRFTMRLGGRNWWTSALTPLSGGPTQSCMVSLETRS